jgi:serine/threonine protein kinase
MKRGKCHISLLPFGIAQEGSVCDRAWLSSIHIPYTQSATVSELYIDVSGKRVRYLNTVSSGTFGYIDFAERVEYDQSTHTSSQRNENCVFVKRPRIKGESLLQEACVQKLVHDSLSKAGFHYGAPNVLDIIRFRDNSVGFTMEMIQNSQTLHTAIERLNETQATRLIIDCICQLSAMIYHLEKDVNLNHRDLKPSNLLIVQRDSPIKKSILIDDIILEIDSHIDISFIDFGFSCIGDSKTLESKLSMGLVYDKKDPCPKSGRDMFLFLAFLYAEFNQRFTDDFIQIMEQWLSVASPKIVGFLKKYGREADNWIYMITGNKDILEIPCKPSTIIKGLQKFLL